METKTNQTHNVVIGYLVWLLGFLGAHRFYYGKPVSGTVYFFTLGLLFVGWIVDLFLIPSMNQKTDLNYVDGYIDYNVSWLLLTYGGLFGLHRIYIGKWTTGVIYMLTGGLFLVGYIYDFWTLNEQISQIHARAS